MKISELIRHWEATSSDALTVREYCIRLTLGDAARVAALAEMYSTRGETEILSELLSAALYELERAMPYIPGKRVIAQDDRGDPIYEDVGPTPSFIDLTEKHILALEKELSSQNAASKSGGSAE